LIRIAAAADDKSTTFTAANFDFTYKQDICNPNTVQFFNVSTNQTNPYWSFGDGTTSTGNFNPVHTYAAPGNYIVKYSLQTAGIPDTIIKNISVAVIYGNIITTNDTVVCYGSSKQLKIAPGSLSFCWTPSTYLDNAALANPTSTPQGNITYYLNEEVTGNNLILNGDFNNGNTGFTSQYNFAVTNITEGEYFVGVSPTAWNASLSNCGDHTSGNSNMLLVNGAPIPDINVWKETITVTPNTNYAFSTWVQALYPPNPAQLSFSINGSALGNLITASLPTCTWTQFYTTWNSGNITSATISIVNKNTEIQGNDFALDDISFAPVLIKRDSVKIMVDQLKIKTNNDTTVCSGAQIKLNTVGATTYSWTPMTGLSNSAIADPVATITSTSTYFVTGTSANGCKGKDSLTVTTYPKSVITITPDTVICRNTSIQIKASGGVTYSWTPNGTLNNSNIYNPVATPATSTTYMVKVTDQHTCSYNDSVAIKLNPAPLFTISTAQNVCTNDSKQLLATGGKSYSWQPANFLDDPYSNAPLATPDVTTTFSVKIKDNTCNDSITLNTVLTVLPLPAVKATKTNDITCSNNFSQLNASGADHYIWSPGKNLNDSTLANPVATIQSSTLFTVQGFDINGCTNTDTTSVNADFSAKTGFYIPTAFTPNKDGLNDCFGIKSWGATTVDFSIYNRFGERVFHTDDPQKCWDGTFKGQLQNPDVFVYIIKAKTNCETVNKKGYFVLVK
jgi:gliding motility-associated-like protein